MYQKAQDMFVWNFWTKFFLKKKKKTRHQADESYCIWSKLLNYNYLSWPESVFCGTVLVIFVFPSHKWIVSAPM